MTTEKLIRGNHAVPLREHVREKYDEALQQRVHAQLSEPTRQAMASVTHDDWIPIEVVGEVNRAIFDAHGGGEAGYRALREAGEAIAAYSVNTFMRLLIKLMTPEMLAKKWPTIWSKGHNFGRMDAELGNEPRHLVLRIGDVKGYSHLGPMAAGFLGFSLHAMGKSDAAVVERDIDYAQPEATTYAFDITW